MARYHYKYGDRPLEGYTIERAVGRGGFGEVYYALSDTGREVAIKAVYTYEQIELRGIQQCMNLKSPNLVSIFDVKYNADGQLFEIMEFVSGPSLADLIQESHGGIGVQKAAFFLREIAKGISYLHESGIVHRDLKPGNVFYENGQVKIGDYGLSKIINTSRYSNQTITVGTVHYMAPEIGVGKYDSSIDIYALGVVLYEMLTGRVPYLGESPTEILMKHLNSEPDLNGIDETFARVITKAMARDPRDRYNTVQEMVEDVFGEEQVRQSMSHFSPQELSMIAGRVADKMPKNQQSKNVNDKVRKKTHNLNPLHEVDQKLDYASKKVADTINRGLHIDQHLDKVGINDPVSFQKRLILSILTLVGVSYASMIILKSNNSFFWAIIFSTRLVCASAGICLSKFYILNEMENGKFKNIVIGALGFVFGSIAMSISGARPELMYAAILLVDWTKIMSPERKERVSIEPVVKVSIITFIASFFLHGELVLGIAFSAGIVLAVQMFCPFRNDPDKVFIKPKKKKNRKNQKQQNYAGSGSNKNRTITLLFCFGSFMGLFGLQRFYVGKIGTGVLYFFTAGLFGIGQLIDLILILCGDFKDADGRVIENWDDSLKSVPNREQYRGVEKQEYSQDYNSVENVSSDNKIFDSNNSYHQGSNRDKSDSSQTFVIEDPNLKIGFGVRCMSLLAHLILFIATLILILRAFNIPYLVQAGFPDPSIAQNINRLWGSDGWVIAVQNLSLLIGISLFIIGFIMLLPIRSKFGSLHIFRGIIGSGLLILSLIIFNEVFPVWNYDGAMQIAPTNKFGVIFDNVLNRLEVAPFVFASILFIISQVIIVWPPKKKPLQVITMGADVSNDNPEKVQRAEV